MSGKRGSIRIVADGYTKVCLTVIAMLLAVLAVALWAESPAPERTASAQVRDEPARAFGDSAAQRLALIDLQKETNAKLSELVALLTSGEAKVQVVAPAKSEAGNAPGKKPQ